jgi:hypothetical protein
MVRFTKNSITGEMVIIINTYDHSHWMPLIRALISLMRNQSEELRLPNNELAFVYDLITELLPDDEIISYVMHNKPELLVNDLENKQSGK